MIKALGLVPYQFLPAKFGGQRAVAFFYEYLSRQVSLSCITTRNNDTAYAKGYEVENILSNSALRYVNIFYFFTLRRMIREKKITHLILEHPYYGWLGILLKWTSPVKLVIHSHNIEGLRWKTLGKWWWKLLWLYEKLVHRIADHSFFIQEADRQYAIRRFGVKPQRCTVATYGIEHAQAPAAAEREKCREALLQKHTIPANHQLLLFNGAFDYAPNENGLRNIISYVQPKLNKLNIPYTLIICGRNIPEDIVTHPPAGMIIAGFVNDIQEYFLGCDIFLNPVVEGGGIKTKLVEALGNNMNAVAVENGAEGVDPSVCGGKLIVTGNTDWDGFARSIQALAGIHTTMPETFYQHFYWGNITAAAVSALKNPAV